MELKEQIAVMQAFADGKKIEVCQRDANNWVSAINPRWDYLANNLKIE